MFDVQLRHVKDSIFTPVSKAVPASITPLQITSFGFLCGLTSCAFAARGHVSLSVTFWLLNRALDCLDGAVARIRNQQSDLGGFLDLLADFIIYALVPISCAAGHNAPPPTLFAINALEASFFINNFVLFYVGAVLEREKHTGDKQVAKELTSVAMRPALIEGFESGLFFTAMLISPEFLYSLSVTMLLGVIIGTAQRIHWLVPVLSQQQRQQHRGKSRQP